MKVRDQIENIADLLLGAMYADRCFSNEEKTALRSLLADLIVRPELPNALQRRIQEFAPERFNIRAAAQEFNRDPPMSPRRLLELVAQLCTADGVLDLDEDEYLQRLGRALGMDPIEYDDLLLDYEMYQLDSAGGRRSAPDQERSEWWARRHSTLRHNKHHH